MKSAALTLTWIFGWLVLGLVASGCASVLPSVARLSSFTLSSLHTNSVSLSYTIPW